jgi:formylmethanofuran dehydrogenase subunit C
MPLRLIYKAAAGIAIELDGIVPAAMRGRPLAEIERLPIWSGNTRVPLAELFGVSGSGDDGLVLEGDLSSVDGIGRGLEQGWLRIVGPAGSHLGASMKGGKIQIEGSAGDWVGAEMRGGTIMIAGSAGDYLGGAYHGSPRGMTGGTILVRGHAGDQAARTMRRGLIAVQGNVGAFAGLDMVAGTLLVFGGCGPAAAAGMRRGTLAVLGPAAALLPSFRPGSICQFQFMRLYLRHLQTLGWSIPDAVIETRYRIHHGDLLNGGRGEVLLRE